MKKIAFISGYDKADILIYISKILTVLEKNVLIIDTTLTQKMRYIVPTMTPELKYVTTFDGIDIAVGFESNVDLLEYLGGSSLEDHKYDYVLYDIDDPYYYESFGLTPEDRHCFLGTFDVYSVKKALNVLKSFNEKTEILKIIVTCDNRSGESEYLDFATFNMKVKWNLTVVYMPFDATDLYEIYHNQRYSKVKFQGLSMELIDSLIFLIENVTDCRGGEIKRAIKMMEKDN